MKGLKVWGWILFATSFVIFWGCIIFLPININRLYAGEVMLLVISLVCFLLSITVWTIIRALKEIEHSI